MNIFAFHKKQAIFFVIAACISLTLSTQSLHLYVLGVHRTDTRLHTNMDLEAIGVRFNCKVFYETSIKMANY